jgi:hypothetical protein
MGISGKELTIAEVVEVIRLRRLGWSIREVMRELDLQIATVAKYGSRSLVANPNALAIIIAARTKAKARVAAKRSMERKKSKSGLVK